MKISTQARSVASIILILILSASSAPIEFIRQIDKPLQYTKCTHRLFFGIGGEKRLHYDTLSIKLSPGFSYAITDQITFCDLPWPIIQIRIKTSQTDRTISDGIDALSLSLRAGLTSSSLLTQLSIKSLHGYPDDYIRIFPHIGLLAKMPLSGYFWTQCDIMTEMIVEEAIQGFLYPRVGCQISKHIYGIIGYRGGFFSFINDYYPAFPVSYLYRYSYALDYYHSSNADKSSNRKVSFSSTMPVLIGIDLSRHISTTIATSVGKKIGVFVPIDVQFQVSW